MMAASGPRDCASRLTARLVMPMFIVAADLPSVAESASATRCDDRLRPVIMTLALGTDMSPARPLRAEMGCISQVHWIDVLGSQISSVYITYLAGHLLSEEYEAGQVAPSQRNVASAAGTASLNVGADQTDTSCSVTAATGLRRGVKSRRFSLVIMKITRCSTRMQCSKA